MALPPNCTCRRAVPALYLTFSEKRLTACRRPLTYRATPRFGRLTRHLHAATTRQARLALPVGQDCRCAWFVTTPAPLVVAVLADTDACLRGSPDSVARTPCLRSVAEHAPSRAFG